MQSNRTLELGTGLFVLLGFVALFFLATQLPEIEEYLNYRSVDVSTVKELARRWFPDAYKGAPLKKGGHRALQDIRESVAELAYYRAAIFDRSKATAKETT